MAQRLLGAFAAEEAAGQRQQVGTPALPLPTAELTAASAPPTNSVAWRASRSVRHAQQGNADVGAEVGSRLQTRQWVISSSPVSPNSCCGRSNSMPNRPVRDEAVRQPARLGEGRQQQGVGPQHETPPARPASAPSRVPPFQNRPPITTGANCATAAKEIRPIETSA
jgi:hypothetical protein